MRVVVVLARVDFVLAPVCVKKPKIVNPRKTFTIVHERSRTCTNVYDRSQTFTNVQRFVRVETFVDCVDGFLGLSVCHLTFDVRR